ncbi:MAG TPA: DUF1223 domain-containing protein [Candidatus Sulfotelmatobacter sp.]|nr:DUF1223 domain-containing protein [Candidatus Sulfotelmatobacter sp.]
MKKAPSLLAIFAIALCSVVFVFAPAFSARASGDMKTPAPVVVELFTSEGCSSCPPADALLMKFQNAQPIQGAKVIAIEEHVDYWNHDGWTDPYSSADWTQRQVDYVLKFKDKTPYTPQMIVDGQTQMTGGQETQAREAIQQAAGQPQTDITLAAGDSSGNSQDFKVRVGKLVGNTSQDSAEIWLAITESGLESSVKAGENAGRDLHHAPVLRSLHKIGTAKGSGDTTFDSSTKVKFKPEWKRQNLQIVVFVQDKKSLRILGAAAVPPSA